jgi:hypothetical protein
LISQGRLLTRPIAECPKPVASQISAGTPTP